MMHPLRSGSGRRPRLRGSWSGCSTTSGVRAPAAVDRAPRVGLPMMAWSPIRMLIAEHRARVDDGGSANRAVMLSSSEAWSCSRLRTTEPQGCCRRSPSPLTSLRKREHSKAKRLASNLGGRPMRVDPPGLPSGGSRGRGQRIRDLVVQLRCRRRRPSAPSEPRSCAWILSGSSQEKMHVRGLARKAR